MKYLKRFLKYTALLLILLILLLIGLGVYALTTNSALRTAVDITNKCSPYHVSAETITGSLNNHAQLTNVTIESGDLHVSAKRLGIHVLVTDLLTGRISVDKASFDDVSIVLPPATPSDNDSLVLPAQPFDIEKTLNSISWLSADIKELELRDIAIYTAPIEKTDDTNTTETKPFLIEYAKLSASYDKSHINIPSATVVLPNAQLHASLVGSLAKQLDVKTTANLSYSDDKDVINSNIEGLITGRWDNYALSLNGSADSQQLGKYDLTLHGNGNTQSLRDIDATLFYAENPLHLTGDIHWEPALAYTLNITADNIPEYKNIPAIRKLSLLANGDETISTISGQGTFESKDIPNTQLNVNIARNGTDLEKLEITANTLGGQLSLSGQGSISPLSLTGELQSHNIQPQQHFPEITANINSRLGISAKEHDGSISVNTLIHSLTGNFQSMPLSGSGAILYTGSDNSINFDTVKTSVAGNTLDADGILSLSQPMKSSFTANINASRLHKLLPALSGTLQAHLVAKGGSQNASLALSAKAQRLAYNDYRIERAVMNGDIDLNKEDISLQLESKGIALQNKNIAEVTLVTKGKWNNHRINLSLLPLSSELPRIRAVAHGAFDKNTTQWKGSLNTLNATAASLGQWNLADAGTIYLSPKSVTLDKNCLQKAGSPETRICIQGHETKNASKDITISLSTIPTAMAKPWLPEGVAIDTHISGVTTVTLNNDDSIKGSGKLQAHGGSIVLQSTNDKISSDIKTISAEFDLQNNTLSSVLLTDTTKFGKAQVTFDMPNINQSMYQTHAIIDVPDITFIQRFAPQARNITGTIKGDVYLRGNAQGNSISGTVALRNGGVFIPAVGSRITDTELTLTGSNNQLIITGKASSGKGNLSLKGKINPFNQQGDISIIAQSFQAANSSKVKLTIDSDMMITLNEAITVSGTLTIPDALITIDSSARTRVTVSEDVILPHQKNKKKPTQSPVALDVQVNLGDAVRIKAADITTRLSGGLHLSAEAGQAPTANGAIAVKKGKLRIYGQELTIDRGRVIFGNGPITNPSLDVRATRTIEEENILVGANILGTVSKPVISLFSQPGMAQPAILSYLMFGRKPDNNSFAMTTLLQTGGNIGIADLGRQLRNSFGLDVLDISLAGMEAGKKLSRKFYVGMRSNFFTAVTDFLLKYQINSTTRIEAIGNGEKAGIDIIKSFETD